MAISGFGRCKGEEGGMVSTVAAPPPAAPSGNLTAFIDQGSKFEGKLSFKDTVRIDGAFTGEISSENTLIVGETGEIEASIKSNTVVISGTVVGDVVAGRQIVLHKTARVEGNLKAPSMVMEQGALMNGSVEMSAGSDSGSGNLKAIKGGSQPQGSAPNKPQADGQSGGDRK